jgi:hypothetical protein
MEYALRFLESALAPAALQRGDEASLRLAEQSRDPELAQAEERTFAAALGQELEARLTPEAGYALLLDLGGSPSLGMRLMELSPYVSRRLRAGGIAYARLDPNPASLAVLRAHAETLRRTIPALPLQTLLLSADPARATLGPSVWSILRRTFSLIITIAPGGRIHAVEDGPGDGSTRAMIRNFLIPADLSLVTLLNPARLDRMFSRLLVLRERGALFEAVRLRPITRTETGALLLGDEQELPLRAYTEPISIAEALKSSEEPSFWSFGVCQRGGPTVPLALVFSHNYLRDHLLSGFSRTRPIEAGEGIITTLRYVH